MSRMFGTWWPLRTLDRWSFPSRWRGRRRTIPVLYLQTTRTSLRREKSEQLICLCVCTCSVSLLHMVHLAGGSRDGTRRWRKQVWVRSRHNSYRPVCNPNFRWKSASRKTEHHMFIAWIPYTLYWDGWKIGTTTQVVSFIHVSWLGATYNICSDENGDWNSPKIDSLMALSFTSGIIILFSYFVHVCVQEWLEATGHKKEIVDLEIAKHKKQWNFPTVQHSFWAGLWTASTGHWLSPSLLSIYQTHYNLLWLLDSFALHMPGKHTDNTQLTNQHINNNNIQTTTTYKQQQRTNNNTQTQATAVRLLVNLCTIMQVIAFFGHRLSLHITIACLFYLFS